MLRRLAAFQDALSRAGFILAACILAFISAAYCYEVVSRYFFNAPTIWASPLVSYALCLTIFLALPDLARRGLQISIDLHEGWASPPTLEILLRLTRLVAAFTCLAAAWITGEQAWSEYSVEFWTNTYMPISEMVALRLHSLWFVERGHLFSATGLWRGTSLKRRGRAVTALILTIVAALTIFVVALLVAGAPVFVGFLAVNIVGILYYFGPSGFGLFANSIFTTATTDSLAAVPLFIVMGELLFRSGTMEVLFASLDRLIGRIRGRQYILCILLSAILGALSGAAMAVAGLLGRSLYPAMIKRGYDPRLSAGTILGGASLDPIIPPSVLAVILATVAQISTGKLLIAGTGPGILLTIMFLVYVGIRLWINPALAPDLASEDDQKKGNALIAVLQMLPACFIFFLVMGLVMLGIATPTEAAATGVFGAFILAYFYGGLNSTMVREFILRRGDRFLASVADHVLRGDVQPAPYFRRRTTAIRRNGSHAGSAGSDADLYNAGFAVLPPYPPVPRSSGALLHPCTDLQANPCGLPCRRDLVLHAAAHRRNGWWDLAAVWLHSFRDEECATELFDVRIVQSGMAIRLDHLPGNVYCRIFSGHCDLASESHGAVRCAKLLLANVLPTHPPARPTVLISQGD